MKWMQKGKRDWVSTLFLTLTPIAAIVGSWIYHSHFELPLGTVAWTILYAVITGVAITAGYHRLYAHRAYQTKAWVEWPFLFFGAAAFQNSVLKWATDHRRHHRKVDTTEDPYSIQEGFWWAHWGWIMHKDTNPAHKVFDRDLLQNPRVVFQKEHFYTIAIGMNFIFPALIASLWGDFWGGLVYAGLWRLVFNHHFTFFINSACHKFGSQPYGMDNSARDAWWLSLVTYGEGYHNFHHHFQADYRNGVRWFDFDPTKWLIRSLAFFGQARNLRQYSDFEILRAKMRTAELKAKQLEITNGKSPIADQLAAASSRVQAAYEHWVALQKQFKEFKSGKSTQFQIQMEQMNQQMNLRSSELKKNFRRKWKNQKRNLSLEMTKARQEFQTNLALWKLTLKQLELQTAV